MRSSLCFKHTHTHTYTQDTILQPATQCCLLPLLHVRINFAMLYPAAGCCVAAAAGAVLADIYHCGRAPAAQAAHGCQFAAASLTAPLESSQRMPAAVARTANAAAVAAAPLIAAAAVAASLLLLAAYPPAVAVARKLVCCLAGP